MNKITLESGPQLGDTIDEFLRSADAVRLAHGNRSTLQAHLVNTREILRAWAQPVWLQDAGAIHSIYSTETYRRQLVPLSERERIRNLAGERAERLAWLFCSISRADLFRKLDLCRPLPPDGFAVELHAAGEGETAVSREDIFALVVLCMANEAEQAQDFEGRPGIWLARVSGWGKTLPEIAAQIPPVFNMCRESVDSETERAARQFWLLGLDSFCTDPDAAGSQFAAASRHCRWIAEPLIGAAYIALWKGDIPRSQNLAEQALDILGEWGTAWDKRVRFADWVHAAEALSRGEHERPTPSEGLRIAGRNLSSPAPVAPPARSDPARCAPEDDPAARRLESYLSLFAVNQRHPRMSLYPGLSSRPWYEASRFAVARELEENFGLIREEARNLERAAFHREAEGLQRSGAWDVFMLYQRGRKVPENCALCPVTTRIVEEHQTVRTLAGAIYFSRMSPGTHIKPHRGTTNMRVRCHLALEVPDGDCALRVGTEIRQWQQGRAMVFDDYYEHEAWNRAIEDRIVLIVDLWHPELTPREIAVIEGMQRYAFLHARDLCAYWSGNESARGGGPQAIR